MSPAHIGFLRVSTGVLEHLDGRFGDGGFGFQARSSTYDRGASQEQNEYGGVKHLSSILEGIGKECYFPPLKLEDGAENTFLETCFRVTRANRIQHWLKNENAPEQEQKTWRYAHFKSHSPFQQKRSVMMATLRKVHTMASDSHVLVPSAVRKLIEFDKLQYPRRMLWTACTTMAVKTRDPAWFRARDQIPPPA